MAVVSPYIPVAILEPLCWTTLLQGHRRQLPSHPVQANLLSSVLDKLSDGHCIGQHSL